jgi:hypothetical protein
MIQKLSDVISLFGSIWPQDKPVLHLRFWKLDSLAKVMVCEQIDSVINSSGDSTVLYRLDGNKNVFLTVLARLLIVLRQTNPDGKSVVRRQAGQKALLGRRVGSACLGDVTRSITSSCPAPRPRSVLSRGPLF